MKRHLCTRLKGQVFNGTALRRPCLPLSAVTASPLTCQDVCVQESRYIVTWGEHLKICCHIITR